MNQNLTIQQAIESVNNCFPSIYTKDDVIKLLNSIKQEQPAPAITAEMKKKIIMDCLDEVGIMSTTSEALDNLDSDEIVYDVDFRLSGNEIEIDSLSLNTRKIGSEVQQDIIYAVEEYIEKIEEEEQKLQEEQDAQNDQLESLVGGQ